MQGVSIPVRSQHLMGPGIANAVCAGSRQPCMWSLPGTLGISKTNKPCLALPREGSRGMRPGLRSSSDEREGQGRGGGDCPASGASGLAWPPLLCTFPACVAWRVCSTSHCLGLLPGKLCTGERAAKDEIHLHKWLGAACTQRGFTNTSSPSPTSVPFKKGFVSGEGVGGGVVVGG